MELKKFLSIHILCVLTFVGFLYYFTIFILLDDLLSLQSSAGKFHSFFFTFMASLIVFSFFVCVLKDPGGVPFSYIPDVEDHEASDQESKRSVSLLFFLQSWNQFVNWENFDSLSVVSVVAAYINWAKVLIWQGHNIFVLNWWLIFGYLLMAEFYIHKISSLVWGSDRLYLQG